jgi:hypothetical protein
MQTVLYPTQQSLLWMQLTAIDKSRSLGKQSEILDFPIDFAHRSFLQSRSSSLDAQKLISFLILILCIKKQYHQLTKTSLRY